MIIAALAALIALAQAPAPNDISYTKISEHVAVLSLDLGDGWISNMTVIESGDGLALVDTLIDPVVTTAAMRLLEHYTDKPVLYVINTNYRREHTGGNQVFRDAVIIAHRNAAAGMTMVEERRVRHLEEMRAELAESLLKQSAITDRTSLEWHQLSDTVETLRRQIGIEEVVRMRLPSRTVDSGNTLSLGGLAIEIRYFPQARTNADIAIFVPAEGVIIAGDIVRNGIFPAVDAESGANVPSLLAAQETLLSYRDHYGYVIPGAGPSGGMDMITYQHDLLVELLGAVKQFKAEGKTLDEALAGIDLKPYEHLTWYKEGREALIRDLWEME